MRLPKIAASSAANPMEGKPHMDEMVMVVCEVCKGDCIFDRVVGHDPSGPVWQDSLCSACQGAGEYAVKREPITIDDLDEMEG